MIDIMKMKQACIASMEWVVNALAFYLIFAVILFTTIPLGKMAEGTTTTAIAYVLVAFVISVFISNRLHEKMTRIRDKCSFKRRASIAIFSIFFIVSAFSLLFGVIVRG